MGFEGGWFGRRVQWGYSEFFVMGSEIAKPSKTPIKAVVHRAGLEPATF
jgi:hypothetical protein